MTGYLAQKRWDEYFIGLCIYAAKKSKDRSTKLGAVIVGPENQVLSMGYNGFPRGVDDEQEEYHERPLKYLITEHAERNAIYNAALSGISLRGSTLYLPFEPTPCCRCTRGVIQAGVVSIVGTTIKFTGKGKQWDEDLAFANQMLKQARLSQRRVVVEEGSELDIRTIQP